MNALLNPIKLYEKFGKYAHIITGAKENRNWKTNKIINELIDLQFKICKNNSFCIQNNPRKILN